jgi:hypothetical protein
MHFDLSPVWLKWERKGMLKSKKIKGLPLFLKILGQLLPISCRIYFSFIYVTIPSHDSNFFFITK